MNFRVMFDSRRILKTAVLAFTETWLNEQDLDTDLHIDGFGTPFGLDRKAEVTGKKQGGGVCLYVNDRYCNAVTVREWICTPDVELLTLSLRICMTVVYIHPKEDAISAANTIFEMERNYSLLHLKHEFYIG